MMRSTIFLALAAASALGAVGGCHRLSALFNSGPTRKAGLWEETSVSDRGPATRKWCFDQASDRRMPVIRRAPTRSGFCSKYQMTNDGSGYVIDAVCGRPGGPTITSHSVVSGDFSTQYVVQTTSTIAGASDPSRNGVHRLTDTWVYKGACPPDIGPGQVELPTGEVVDMAQLRRGFGGGGGGRGGGPGGVGNSAPANAAAGPSSGSGPPGGGGGGPPSRQ
jgi:hypothetical protein